MSASSRDLPIGILYEHPEWFVPLFKTLDRRGLPYERIPAHAHTFDPDERSAPYSLVVNRVSPSSYLRGHGRAIGYARHYLAHLEQLGVPLVNGSRAYAMELSKALQLSLLADLGLPHPKSRVLNDPDQLRSAASALEFPLIAKPNVGGSGALMQRFDSVDDLVQADVDDLFAQDGTAILQEYHPQASGSIVRVEALDDRPLYAIRISNDPRQGFNLCPADICQVPGATVRPVEATQPPPWVQDAVLRIFRTAGIDIGGVEYLESARDGQIYFYDINSLSNFVADAPNVVGFDPFERFVDYIERRWHGSRDSRRAA
jgi:glutathione synthase/RimK-type ligase-like ATP-grasp enzyme